MLTRKEINTLKLIHNIFDGEHESIENVYGKLRDEGFPAKAAMELAYLYSKNYRNDVDDYGSITNPERMERTLTLNLEVDEIDTYLRIGRDLRNDIIERILNGDLYESYDDDDWKYMVDYVNDENKETIFEYIRNNFPDIDITNGDLEEIIKENEDDLDEVINALNRAVSDAEAQDYERYCYNQLKSTLEYWGTVRELSSDGAVIEVNTDNLLKDVDDDYLGDAFEKCNGNMECAFHELVYDGSIDKPKFYLDDRYTPSADRENFNDILVDTLNEI